MPTMFTVITSVTANFREFRTNLPMLPAKKNRITAQGSRVPSGFTVLNTLARVLKQGTTMKPMKM